MSRRKTGLRGGLSTLHFNKRGHFLLELKDLVAFVSSILWLLPLFQYACPQFRGDRGNEIMATSNSLNVFLREKSGRSASRRLRRDDHFPAILYGKHTEPEKLTVDAREFTKLLRSISGRKTIIELKQVGKDAPALSFLQEVQRDPIKDIVLHADFQEIRPDEKFEVEVPVKVFGECKGVRYQNGILEIATHSVRVRCLAKDLPGAIDVDISALEVEQTIKVRNLPALDGVEYRDSEGQTIVACLQGELEEETPAEGAAAPVKK